MQHNLLELTQIGMSLELKLLYTSFHPHMSLQQCDAGLHIAVNT